MASAEAVAWLQREIGNDHAFALACLARPFPGSDMDAIAERVADGEAKLAIVGEHPEYSGQLPRFSGCATCMREEGDNFWPCRTLQLLASAYRHREGYAEHWGTVVQR
jgi:hypothetical protein